MTSPDSRHLTGSHASSDQPRLQELRYRIKQKKPGGGTVQVARSDHLSHEAANDILSNTSEVLQAWLLWPLPGVENSFRIGPDESPVLDEGDSRYWGLYAAETSVQLNLSSYSSVWNVEFEETSTEHNTKGVPRRIYSKCSIREAGTNRYWTTDGQGKIQLCEVPDESLSESQLYEIAQLLSKPIPERKQEFAISSLMPLSVTACDAKLTRKLYFSTNKLSPGYLPRYSHVQIVTDARNLESSDEPGRAESTWFELAILSALPEEGQEVTDQHIKFSEGKPMTWESHRLPVRKDSSYHKLIGRKLFGLADCIEEGDYIGVLACTQSEHAGCEVRSGKLIIFEH